MFGLVNDQLWQATRRRSHCLDEQSALKVLYLAIQRREDQEQGRRKPYREDQQMED